MCLTGSREDATQSSMGNKGTNSELPMYAVLHLTHYILAPCREHIASLPQETLPKETQQSCDSN